MKKHSYEYVKGFIESKSDCKLLSKDYKGNKNKLSLMCGCGNLFETTFSDFSSAGKRQCNECGYKISAKKQKKYTTKTFKEKIKELTNNEYAVLGKYVNVDTKVLMKHNECGHEYYVTPDKFMGVNQRRCPRCNKGVKRSFKDFAKEVSLRENYELVSKEYVNCFTKVKFKHSSCGEIFEMRPHDFLNGQGCPRCRSSKGERKVIRALKKYGLQFVHQYKFEDCVHERPLPFDFAVIINDRVGLLIEFHGVQHYENFRFEDEKTETSSLELRQLRDRIKSDYCKDRNLDLLVIPYWDMDRIDEIIKNIANKYKYANTEVN